MMPYRITAVSGTKYLPKYNTRSAHIRDTELFCCFPKSAAAFRVATAYDAAVLPVYNVKRHWCLHDLTAEGKASSVARGSNTNRLRPDAL